MGDEFEANGKIQNYPCFFHIENIIKKLTLKS